MDASKECHICHGENSRAEYTKHPVNVLPDMKGVAIQTLVTNKPVIN